MAHDAAGLGEQAGEIGDKLRRSVMDFEPGVGAEQKVYTQALTLVQDLDEERALRLLEAREDTPSCSVGGADLGRGNHGVLRSPIRYEDAAASRADGGAAFTGVLALLNQDSGARVPIRRHRPGDASGIRDGPRQDRSRRQIKAEPSAEGRPPRAILVPCAGSLPFTRGGCGGVPAVGR